MGAFKTNYSDIRLANELKVIVLCDEILIIYLNHLTFSTFYVIISVGYFLFLEN